MTRTHEIRPDIDDGIDRKVLKQLRERFLAINQGRLARANQALSSRQQLVLQLLPLLLHVNHPMLPGYVSTNTPAGLSSYTPSDDTLAQVQRLTRSFSYKPRHKTAPAPLHGLFLMGSLGTLAQAEQSDMDLWLCHDPQLNEQQLFELSRKCRLLEAWATTFGAEVHVFLVDPLRFAQGAREAQLTSDDCGTTQHYLLLDEFYRTAIWLGGRTPIWWMVPAYEEAHYSEYCQTLLRKRFIREDDVLDLGHLAHIPAQEFIGAGMWQLYKAIESPYKSVLKLLLTEVYASEHLGLECLALHFKRRVFEGESNLDELDPYVMLYQRLAQYLIAQGDLERLELMRRCLYLKVEKKLSRPPVRGRAKSWQRVLLERLTHNWQWPAQHLALLDSRSQWKYRQVVHERRTLVNELTYSYRFLSQFARTAQVGSTLNDRDLNVLGRRLYAAFERKSGKVEFINPGIAPDLAEDTLTLAQCATDNAPLGHQWALFNGSLSAAECADFAPLKRAYELTELLVWCHRNGVIDSGTHLSLHPGESDLTEPELNNLITSLRQCIPVPLPPVESAALMQPARPTRVLLLLNVGLDPLKHHSQMNLHMTSDHTDSLGYSGVRDNLVLTVDRVSLNSWNELMVHHYHSSDALLDCLSELLSTLPKGAVLPAIEVRCFCRNRAAAIASRVKQLLEDLLLHYQQGEHSRYLLKIRQHYHLLQLNRGHVSHRQVGDLPALMSELASEQRHYSTLHVDRNALPGSPLALLLPLGQQHCIQVFYQLDEQANTADIYILDELNSLWQQRLTYQNEQNLLAPLQRFLESMLYRRNAQMPLDDQPNVPLLEVHYYQLRPNAPQRAKHIELRQLMPSLPSQTLHDVKAIIESRGDCGRHVSLFCNQREFSELEYGPQLYQAVAEHIRSLRSSEEPYPYYISDLDLSGVVAQAQTLHYLRYKAELDSALNEALGAPEPRH